MIENKQRSVDPGKFRQFLAALVVNLSALSYGTMVGWQSPMAPLLQSDDPPVGTEPMSDEAASWLSGIMCLSGTFMTLVVGIIAEKFGRKMTGYLMALPLCITWLLMIFATDHLCIYFARFFSGIGGATALFLVPLYVSEISCDRIRGMLGSLLVFTLNTGTLLSYVMGTFLSFRVFAIVAIIPPILFLGIFVFLPETPVFLVRRNRLHEAASSLMWFRGGNKATVDEEMIRLQAEVKEMNASTKSVRLSDLFRDRGTIKGLVITLGLFGGQQLCGIFAMISYTEMIFRLSGSSMSPNMSAITVGAIQVFGSYLSTSLMERMGRRPLILISCFGMCVCHYVLATFCYLQELEYETSSFAWIPIVALSGYVIVYCLGMGPGPYVITSEIFARDVTSLATTVGLLFVWSMAFLVVKFFPNLVTLIGIHGCFFFLGTSCACSFVFVFLLLPETKGRPRQLILDQLNGVSYVPDETKYVSAKSIDGKIMPIAEQV